MNDIFKTSDLSTTDRLYPEKKDCIESLQKLYTGNMNDAREDSDDWIRKGYFTYPLYLEERDMEAAFEEEKSFVNWFLDKYPQYNTIYNPKNRKVKRKIVGSAYGSVEYIEVYRMARKRDLLFGTNGTSKVTVNNWREKVRDAQTVEEIEDIQDMIDGGKAVNNFVRSVKIYVDLFVQSIQNVRYEIRKPIRPEVVGIRDKEIHKLFFDKNTAGGALNLLERKIFDENMAWGLCEKLSRFHKESKMDCSWLIARRLIADEIKRVMEEAKKKAQQVGLKWDRRELPMMKKSREDPTPKAPPIPAPNPVPQDNSEELSPEKEAESQEELNKLEAKLKEINQKVKEDKTPNNEKTPWQPKQKIKDISQLKEQLSKLEKDKNSGVSSTIIDELKERIKGLEEEVKDLKKSLKIVLEESKEYAQKLFNWFKKESVKQITFEEDGTAKVEYENNKDSETLSVREIDDQQELVVLRENFRQSEEKSLSRQELSQIIGSFSSPASTEKSHWENYKYYYFVGMGVALLAIGGLVVYWKRKKRINLGNHKD